MSALELPEGYEARFEHHRRVVVFAEFHPPAECGPLVGSSDVTWMRSWEWSKTRDAGFGVEVLPNGGVTRCRVYKITEGDTPNELIATADCICSNDDNYVKALGRTKSLGRTLAVLRKTPYVEEVVA